MLDRRLPLTYLECRAGFERAAVTARVHVDVHPITARGPHGEELALQSCRIGSSSPRRALLVMSGVHGVEGFLGSALQCDLLTRLDPGALADDVAVVVVHAVNPWGMAWWRRQNEHNVDLNRNWRRDDGVAHHNDAYDEVHGLACPDTADLPSADELLAATSALAAERGLVWLRDAITVGQYRHPDGLHFGGDRTEASTTVVARIVADALAGVERLLTLDLHTGHGPRGAVTFLSDQPIGSPQDEFLRRHFGGERVEATAGNADATTGVTSGQVASGIRDLLADATCFASSVEVGTVGDVAQLVATYHEHWVHRHGDRSFGPHAAAVWRYRSCFTPDDPDWERTSFDDGRTVLDRALVAVGTWS